MTPIHRFCIFWLSAIAISCPTIGAAEFSSQQIEFFEKSIRPVLVEHCYACHNSAETAEGGIEIDSRQGMLDADIIKPGDPNKSQLLAVIRHEVEDMEMPKDGPKLDDRVISDFAEWIKMGTPDPRDFPPSAKELEAATSWEATLKRRKSWWSFQPIVRQTPPNTEWGAHPIDQFVVEKQKENGLNPADRAKSNVLVRRAFFALIGLPPSPDEVLAWSKRIDSGSDGYQQLVDHLLESPHFGERWARHWMDWIRYAESHGSEGDPRIDNAWYYRDYLIRALNRDVPYDQLVREHVAGDLLAEPRINAELGLNESAIGPAHWRMVFHGFAPTDALDEKVRFVDDQVNVLSKTFLGLTVSCARCHDHKFDAISQKDYYALFGILASCRPARTVIDTTERQTKHLDELSAKKKNIRTAIADDWLKSLPTSEQLLEAAKKVDKPDSLLRTLHAAIQRIEKGDSAVDVWNSESTKHAQQQQRRETFGTENVIAKWDLSDPQDHGRWYRQGTGLGTAPNIAGGFALRSDGDALQGIYPAGAYSHLVSTKHAARLTSPDVVLDGEAELWVQVIGDAGAQSRYVVQDYPRNGTVYPVTNLAPQWKWQRYDLKYWDGDSIHIELSTGKDSPLLVKNNDRSWFGIRKAVLVRSGTKGPANLSAALDCVFENTDADAPENLSDIARRHVEAIKSAILAWRSEASSDAQADLLWQCVSEGLLTNKLNSLPTAKPQIEKYRELESEIPVPTRVPGLDETRGRTQPLFVRGNHKTPGDLTPRRFLEAIDASPYETESSGRLQLAQDLLRNDNPLTKRVIVNRIWHHLFGKGIVATPDNFGRLGIQPTHPELLDFLATQFADDGWSLKKMIRLIVTSKAWQQSAITEPANVKADPENLYLARANVRRLEAEAIRDSMLVAAGRLDRARFGEPANEGSNRRSVYVRVIRNSLVPLLRAFDFPEPFTTTGRRDITNVPAQSLMLMNDRQVLEYAKSMANQAIASNETNEQRIQWMFSRALSRKPSDQEIQQALDFIADCKSDTKVLQQEQQKLENAIATLGDQIGSIQKPVRNRLLAMAKQGAPDGATMVPKPLYSWDFGTNTLAANAPLNAKTNGGANVKDGALLVRSGGFVTTDTLQKDLAEKTLEAWVQLDNLSQRGGGVLTVQTRNGVTFDSIVFGEQQPGQWLAGSNSFQRTQPFGGPPEKHAVKQPVHFAITYHADGTITGYRNGEPYGKPYKSSGLMKFKARDTIVSFGVRHLPASGNRLLSGRITKANLYDRALSASEIKATSGSTAFFITDEQIVNALEPHLRRKLAELRTQQQATTKRLSSLGPVPAVNDTALLTEFARTLFTFKEFIFIQ